MFLNILPECLPHKAIVFCPVSFCFVLFFSSQHIYFFATNLYLLSLLSQGHSLWHCCLGTALQNNSKFNIMEKAKIKNSLTRGCRLFNSKLFTSCTFAYIWCSLALRRAFNSLGMVVFLVFCEEAGGSRSYSFIKKGESILTSFLTIKYSMTP